MVNVIITPFLYKFQNKWIFLKNSHKEHQEDREHKEVSIIFIGDELTFLIIFIFGLVPLKTEESQAFSLSAATLKKKYIFIAKNQFIRNPPITVLNKDTNWPIALSSYRVWNQIDNIPNSNFASSHLCEIKFGNNALSIICPANDVSHDWWKYHFQT